MTFDIKDITTTFKIGEAVVYTSERYKCDKCLKWTIGIVHSIDRGKFLISYEIKLHVPRKCDDKCDFAYNVFSDEMKRFDDLTKIEKFRALIHTYYELMHDDIDLLKALCKNTCPSRDKWFCASGFERVAYKVDCPIIREQGWGYKS